MTQILEDELVADPLSRGYSGMTDAELLTSLNAADRDRNRTSMTGREVKSQIDAAEFAAKTDAQKQQIIELLKRDDLDLFGLDKEILADIFGSSTTETNLLAARVESISRATELGLPEIDARYLRMHTLSRKVPN
jgi:antitoxin component HigA of HigAB toxin-antitoxin module